MPRACISSTRTPPTLRVGEDVTRIEPARRLGGRGVAVLVCSACVVRGEGDAPGAQPGRGRWAGGAAARADLGGSGEGWRAARLARHGGGRARPRDSPRVARGGAGGSRGRGRGGPRGGGGGRRHGAGHGGA